MIAGTERVLDEPSPGHLRPAWFRWTVLALTACFGVLISIALFRFITATVAWLNDAPELTQGLHVAQMRSSAHQVMTLSGFVLFPYAVAQSDATRNRRRLTLVLLLMGGGFVITVLERVLGWQRVY